MKAWAVSKANAAASIRDDERAKSERPCRARRSPGWRPLIILVLFGIGAALRIGYFSFDREFWGDEASLALNLRDRSVAQLLSPLDHNQHAPLLYLLIERGIVTVIGVNEYALRLPSLLMSLLALPLFYWFMRRVAGGAGMTLGLALFALCPGLIRYAAELKPYAGDVVATLIVCLLALEVWLTGFTPRPLLLFAAAGCVLVWFSFTSVFVLCGAGLVLIGAEGWRGNYRNALAAALVASAWLASFVAYFATMSRHSLANHELTSFWAYYFAPLPPRSLWELRRLIELSLEPFRDPLGFADFSLASVLFVLGLAAMAKWHCRAAALCLLPPVVTLAASGQHLYPYAGRLILFLAPLFLVPVACGVASLRSAVGSRTVLATVMLLLLWGPMAGVNDLYRAPQQSGIRDLNAALADRLAPADLVYVYYKSQMSFTLYKDRLRSDDARVVYGTRPAGEEPRYLDDLDALGDQKNVWFIFSEVRRFSGDEERIMVDALDRRGKRLDEIVVPGAHAYRYRLDKGARNG